MSTSGDYYTFNVHTCLCTCDVCSHMIRSQNFKKVVMLLGMSNQHLKFHELQVVDCLCNCECIECKTHRAEASMKKAEEEKSGRIALAPVNVNTSIPTGETPPPSPIPVIAEDRAYIPVSMPIAEPVLFQRPPRKISPELNWPFVRCKLVYRALRPKQPRFISYPIGNHKWLLQWLADWFHLPLEDFKTMSLYDLAKGKPELFTYEARTKLFSTYPHWCEIGRELRSVLKL